MESKDRTVWIILGVVGLISCCCILAVVAGAGFFALRTPTIETFGLAGRLEEPTEWSFEVGDEPVLNVTNFAGAVRVRSGDEGAISVVAVKKASSGRNLDRIRIAVSERGSREDVVEIVTTKSFASGSGSVELEITAPPGTQLKVDTGAGAVDVSGITGPIDIHSGAGSIEVLGASGSIKVRLGAGNINYDGSPAGDCSFESGAGNIMLRMPATLNMEVQLSTGAGNVSVDYHVDGRVTRQSVRGVVGDGSQGTVYAHAGAGNIDIVPR